MISIQQKRNFAERPVRKERQIDLATSRIDTKQRSTEPVETLLVWNLVDKEFVVIGYDKNFKICWNACNLDVDQILPFKIRRMSLEKLIDGVAQLKFKRLATNNYIAAKSIMSKCKRQFPIESTRGVTLIEYIEAMNEKGNQSKAVDVKSSILSYKECLKLDSTMTKSEYKVYLKNC